MNSKPTHSLSHFLGGLLAVAAGGVAPALAQAPGAVGDLYVTEEATGEVHRHHGVSGVSLGVFATVAAPRRLMAIHSGVTFGHVLVGSDGGGVRELHRDSGAPIRTYNPLGGWQWAGVYAPNGQVLIGSMATNDVRRYRRSDGALLGVFGNVPGPADMVFGPNGNLFVCSFTAGGVYELNGNNGALVAWRVPGVAAANDIVFLADGRRIVTSMGTNRAHVFDGNWTQLATFAGTGWGRPHGIDISPHDGNIHVVDGVTASVHVFDKTTYEELDASFVTIDSKPVDIEFRRASPAAGDFSRYGNGCHGLLIGNDGLPEIGMPFDVTLSGAAAARVALLFLGGSRATWNGIPLPLPLDLIGAPGCSLLASGEVMVPTVTDGAGNAHVTLVVPPLPELVGAELFGQWVVRQPGVNALGFVTSDAAAIRIGG
jgi:hypothetical protein